MKIRGSGVHKFGLVDGLTAADIHFLLGLTQDGTIDVRVLILAFKRGVQSEMHLQEMVRKKTIKQKESSNEK